MRVRLVLTGVQTIAATHPHAPLYALAFGFVKSTAFVLLKYAVDAALGGGVRGRPLVINHHSSKSCILAAAAFTAHIYGFLGGGEDAVSLDAIFTLIVAFMVTKRLSAMAVSDFDPYSAGEGAVCSLLFGSAEEASAGPEEKKAAPSRPKVCSGSTVSNDVACLSIRKTWSGIVNQSFLFTIS